MDNPKNLWGEIPKAEIKRTPYTILKEQASQLSRITNGLLIGDVYKNLKQNPLASNLIAQNNPSQSGYQERFVNILRIKAPSLNNYTYSVVQVEYPITLYPAKVRGLAVEDFSQECQNEEEFEQALGEILSSEPVKRAVSTLLAQIRADLPEQAVS
jgi:hypothetical protein